MFYRAAVKPGRPAPFVPPPEEHMLHLSQAALAHDVPEGTRASLLVKTGPEEAPALLCTLCAGRLDTVCLDQFFSHYAEFSVAGGATIHISGCAGVQAADLKPGWSSARSSWVQHAQPRPLLHAKAEHAMCQHNLMRSHVHSNLYIFLCFAATTRPSSPRTMRAWARTRRRCGVCAVCVVCV